MSVLLSLVLLIGQVGNPMLGGVATWFDYPAGHAAAGPSLRAALGPGWRGDVVQVCADSGCVAVVVDGWCACGDRNGKDTLLDLAKSDFAKLADPSVGVVAVTVEVLDVVLPATDGERSWWDWLNVVR